MKKSFSLAFLLLTLVSMTSLLMGCNDSPTNQSDQNGSQTKPSNQNVTFSCEQKDQEWTTTVKNGQQTSDLIIWQRTDFVPAGFPPERRCQDVTPRLQEAHNNGSLSGLTHGKMADERGKKQKVLCTYDQDNKQCKTLILTLLSKDNPQQQLRKFTAVLNGDAKAPYSNLFGENNNNCKKNGQRLYCTININNRLNKQDLTTNK